MTLILVWSFIAAMADGDSAMARSDYTSAAMEYRAEMAAHPDQFDPKFKLARALSYSKQRDEAIRLYTELLATRPDNSDLLLARGRTYAWQGKWQESEADLTAVTAKSPEYADAWSALGDMYLWSDRPRDAAGAYGRWIAAKPEDPRAYIARAKAWRSAGDLDAARADFEAARLHGASGTEIDGYIASLDQRRQNQDAFIPEEYKWSGSLSYGASDWAPDRGDWYDYSASVRRHFDIGSLAFEYLHAHRFARDDDAFALDGYIDLWPRAYANLRYQYSPDAILFPDDAYRVELWQGVGKGWEPSLSYDHMNFGANGVDMYGAGLGKYLGNWYLRWKTLVIPSTAKTSLSHRALARYYYAGNADDYAEVNGGFGTGGEFRRRSTIVENTKSSGVGVAIQKYFHPRWGVKIAASYDDDDNSFVERSGSVSLYTRW
ncbi:MAG: YaiO family outer membrane beta-barrel protein [Candidatus Hydrogenedentota bacterium]